MSRAVKFLVTVEDESMSGNILPGDVLTITSGYEAEDGHVVAAMVNYDDAEMTVFLIRRLRIINDHHIALCASNPAFPPLTFSPKEFMERVRIFGIVTHMERYFHDGHHQYLPKKIIRARRNRSALEHNDKSAVIFEQGR